LNLRNKKKMASQILKAGVNRVKIDPGSIDRLEDAITKENIKGLINEGIIWAERAKGISRGRVKIRKASAKKRGKGSGSKKGSKGARQPKKKLYMSKVRAMRNHLKYIKGKGYITNELFKKLYSKVRGGQIRNLRHLKERIKQSSTGGI
jgi:large subunit ribosomal protein L19e